MSNDQFAIKRHRGVANFVAPRRGLFCNWLRRGMSSTFPPRYSVKRMEMLFKSLDGVVVGINKVFVFLASVMMAGLVIVVCIDLSLRYFYNAPLLWGTEVTEILLLDITFLGMAWVFREEGHVVIDVFTSKVTGRKKAILTGVSYLLTGIIAAVLIYYGFYTTWDHYARRIFNPTVIETPIALIILVIPLGSVPLFLEVLVKGRKLLKNP
jgi:C4-dicarboxylate transporter DctQ subunit